MKRSSLSIILIIIAGLGLLMACGEDRKEPAKSETKVTAENVKQETKEALKTALEYTQQQQDEYQTEILSNLVGRETPPPVISYAASCSSPSIKILFSNTRGIKL